MPFFVDGMRVVHLLKKSYDPQIEIRKIQIVFEEG
jgi:hypothetical protein